MPTLLLLRPRRDGEMRASTDEKAVTKEECWGKFPTEDRNAQPAVEGCFADPTSQDTEWVTFHILTFPIM
ncbi:hypothetical protein A6R68_12465 [Neotoma lepida]|uniref:Uncharacterized protein n=1 Tax=Neotoma lepida TaxID=56216 RepID=A0A1A6H5Q9_NEOLE|nr:hypothetical protein A6R68_12465 [Neotoma lepida]